VVTKFGYFVVEIVFAPIPYLEAIRVVLAFASSKIQTFQKRY
jgi:hypothetical protein